MLLEEFPTLQTLCALCVYQHKVPVTRMMVGDQVYDNLIFLLRVFGVLLHISQVLVTLIHVYSKS